MTVAKEHLVKTMRVSAFVCTVLPQFSFSVCTCGQARVYAHVCAYVQSYVPVSFYSHGVIPIVLSQNLLGVMGLCVLLVYICTGACMRTFDFQAFYRCTCV